MNQSEKTPLETALLTVFHELYGNIGFPLPDAIRVVGMTNTGGGRYTNLECDGTIQSSGVLDLGGRFVEMGGVPHGLMAVVRVNDNQLQDLELAVYGGHPWDGEERDWAIV